MFNKKIKSKVYCAKGSFDNIDVINKVYDAANLGLSGKMAVRVAPPYSNGTTPRVDSRLLKQLFKSIPNGDIVDSCCLYMPMFDAESYKTILENLYGNIAKVDVLDGNNVCLKTMLDGEEKEVINVSNKLLNYDSLLFVSYFDSYDAQHDRIFGSINAMEDDENVIMDVFDNSMIDSNLTEPIGGCLVPGEYGAYESVSRGVSSKEGKYVMHMFHKNNLRQGFDHFEHYKKYSSFIDFKKMYAAKGMLENYVGKIAFLNIVELNNNEFYILISTDPISIDVASSVMSRKHFRPKEYNSKFLKMLKNNYKLQQILGIGSVEYNLIEV